MPDFQRYIPTTEATIDNIAKAVMCPDFIGIELRFDSFRDEIIFAPVGTCCWQTFTDDDYTRLRITLEKRGFKAVGRELIRDVVSLAATKNTFDSAIDWIQSLEWDGTPRIETFYHTHFGTEDSPYTRAVSRYMWTALAGRVLKPGIKADKMPILVGVQGCGKSSGVEALSPDPDFFIETSFSEKQCNLARKMRGCLVVEISELRGTKKLASIKAFAKRTHDKWIPKFKEFATRYPRRSLNIGTTSSYEFLGDRRWLPVKVLDKVNVEAIRADVNQLWAEARDVFNKTGIEFEVALHKKYLISDTWQETIERWLDEPDTITGQTPRELPFLRSEDVLREAIHLEPKEITRYDQILISHALKNCHFKKVQRRINGKVLRIWEPEKK